MLTFLVRCKEVRSGSCVSPTQTIYPQDCSKSFYSSLSGRHSNDRQGMAFLKVWMAPCSYQCHTEEGRSHCSFSNSFGTRVSMGLATAPRTHVTNSVLHCTATSPETLKKWDETKIRRCSLQEVLMNKRQCELPKVTETPRPSVRRVPSLREWDPVRPPWIYSVFTRCLNTFYNKQ